MMTSGMHLKTETREIETPNIEWSCSREKQKETRASDGEVQGKGCAANDCGAVCVSSEPGAEGKSEGSFISGETHIATKAWLDCG